MKRKLDMYAYVCPTNGEYVDERGEKLFNGDFRTEERYREYKDCGFDTLLLLGNDEYDGDYENSDLKRNLSLCEKTGLNCIAYDKYIYELSQKTSALVGDGCMFDSDNRLIGRLIGRMEPYFKNPRFRGLEFVDEPKAENFAAIGDLYAALRKIDEKIYVNTVLLPFVEGMEKSYTDKNLFGIKAYEDYIDEWFLVTKSKSFDFDVYPFVFGEGETESDEGHIFPVYLLNMQTVAKKVKEHNAEFYVVLQSYASRSGAKNCAFKRKMGLADFRYQKNVALSFGAKDFRYYTYWLFPNQLGDPSSEAIMTEKGEKVYYDYVKTVNEELKKEFETIGDYDYVKTELIGELPHFKGVVSEKIEGVVIAADVPIIVNEMKTGKKRALYIVNADNPSKKIKANVSFACDSKSVKVLLNGNRTEYCEANGKYKIVLNEGEGAFIEL